ERGAVGGAEGEAAGGSRQLAIDVEPAGGVFDGGGGGGPGGEGEVEAGAGRIGRPGAERQSEGGVVGDLVLDGIGGGSAAGALAWKVCRAGGRGPVGPKVHGHRGGARKVDRPAGWHFDEIIDAIEAEGLAGDAGGEGGAVSQGAGGGPGDVGGGAFAGPP